jgi:hypothetical protein
MLPGMSERALLCPYKSDIKMRRGVEHWWNDTDRGKLKYWDKNLSQ